MDRPEEGEQRIETLIPKVEAEPKGWRHKHFQIKNNPSFPVPVNENLSFPPV